MSTPTCSDSFVHVTAPARLHMGFLDPSGGLGRRFGSLGLALDQPATRLRIARAPAFLVTGPQADRAQRYAQEMIGRLNLPGGVAIRIQECIPAHSGLGSGTQMALAVGTALAHLYELNMSAHDIAHLLQRGARSGIGIGAFEQGGLLLDGGRGARSQPPPLVARAPFPEPWRVLLVLERNRRGVAGDRERRAFDGLAEFPSSAAGELCRLVLMQVLPAMVEADIRAFGAAVTQIQRRVGDYFAPVQGGRYTSSAVSEVLSWCERERVYGIGQSSWGPTGFGFCESEAQAEAVRNQLAARWGRESNLSFMVCRGRNDPGDVHWHTAEHRHTQGGLGQ